MNNTTWIKALSVSAMISLAGCGGEPEWVSVYDDCKDHINKNFTEMKQSSDTPKAASDFMHSIGMTACEMIKTSCENDPEGATCQAIINSREEDK